jgi:hypothetical protein
MGTDRLLNLVERTQRLERAVVKRLLLCNSRALGACCCSCTACPRPVPNICLVLPLQLSFVEALARQHPLRILSLQIARTSVLWEAGCIALDFL